jgi:hypothetical protein
MTEPEGRPHEIPSGQEEHHSPEKKREPLELEGSSQGATPQHNDKKSPKTYNIRERMRKFWTFLKKVPPIGYLAKIHSDDRATFWIVIFTALLVFFTYKLVVVTDKVDETTRITQGAFVSLQGVFHSQKGIVNQRWTTEQMIALWNNGGATAAIRGNASANYHSWMTGIPKDFDYPDGGVEPFQLGPKGTGGPAINIPITEMGSAKAGSSQLFVWGWATYYSVFEDSKMHLAEFCVQIVGIQSKLADFSDPNNDIGWQQLTCGRKHNCYDRDCKDYEQKMNLK